MSFYESNAFGTHQKSIHFYILFNFIVWDFNEIMFSNILLKNTYHINNDNNYCVTQIIKCIWMYLSENKSNKQKFLLNKNIRFETKLR